MRQLVSQAVRLLSGSSAGLGLALLSTLILAKALELTEFGVLVIIQAVVILPNRLLSLQAGQYCIKYLRPAIDMSDRSAFARVLGHCVLLDALSAITGFVVLTLSASFIVDVTALSSEHVWLVLAYSLTILFNFSGTNTGLMRALDHVGAVSIYFAWSGGAKAFVAFFVLVFEASLEQAVIGLTVAEIATQIGLSLYGAHAARRYLSTKSERDDALLGSHGDVSYRQLDLRFALTAGLTASVRGASRELDVILLSVIVDASAIAYYRLAKQIASVPLLATDALYYVVYPEFVSLWAQGNREGFHKLLKVNFRIGAFLGVVAYVVLLAIVPWVVEFIGEDYAPLRFYVPVYAVSTLVAAATFPISPGLIASNRQHLLLTVILIATAVFFGSFATLAYLFGLTGAIVAHVLFYAAWAPLAYWSLPKYEKGG